MIRNSFNHAFQCSRSLVFENRNGIKNARIAVKMKGHSNLSRSKCANTTKTRIDNEAINVPDIPVSTGARLGNGA